MVLDVKLSGVMTSSAMAVSSINIAYTVEPLKIPLLIAAKGGLRSATKKSLMRTQWTFRGTEVMLQVSLLEMAIGRSGKIIVRLLLISEGSRELRQKQAFSFTRSLLHRRKLTRIP